LHAKSEAKIRLFSYKQFCKNITRLNFVKKNNGVRMVWSSNPESAKSYKALQTVWHRFNIYASSSVALALWRADGHRKLMWGKVWFGNMPL